MAMNLHIHGFFGSHIGHYGNHVKSFMNQLGYSILLIYLLKKIITVANFVLFPIIGFMLTRKDYLNIYFNTAIYKGVKYGYIFL